MFVPAISYIKSRQHQAKQAAGTNELHASTEALQALNDAGPEPPSIATPF